MRALGGRARQRAVLGGAVVEQVQRVAPDMPLLLRQVRASNKPGAGHPARGAWRARESRAQPLPRARPLPRAEGCGCARGAASQATLYPMPRMHTRLCSAARSARSSGGDLAVFLHLRRSGAGRRDHSSQREALSAERPPPTIVPSPLDVGIASAECAKRCRVEVIRWSSMHAEGQLAGAMGPAAVGGADLGPGEAGAMDIAVRRPQSKAQRKEAYREARRRVRRQLSGKRDVEGRVGC